MIDTEAKRRSAVATRRLPWFRRFTLPKPDGAIGQADRQQVAFVYGGILASAGVVAVPIYRPTIVYDPTRSAITYDPTRATIVYNP